MNFGRSAAVPLLLLLSLIVPVHSSELLLPSVPLLAYTHTRCDAKDVA